MITKLGILTSGGDAPGMNPAIRGVTRYALDKGIAVEGILRGYEGLLRQESILLDQRSVGEIIHRGGTMLRTARCEAFIHEDAQRQAVDFLRSKEIEALIVVGGDGSMKGAQCLSRLGMPTITIPGTIDNDMPGTEYTLGFDTAVNTVLQSVNKIRDTAYSHERVAVVEVMGRHAGFIALHAGMASGAEAVLVPEHDVSLEELCNRLYESHQHRKLSSIVIVAEGAMSGSDVVSYIKEHTYLEPSLTVLGYVQRGGAPTALDAILAGLFAQKAVDCLCQGTVNVVIGLLQNRLVATPYTETDRMHFSIDDNMYNLLHQLGK
ncbi:6-phosphofructokinase [Megasphaera paucivorans]|uniref:ATP-dependent 6-phosphofructokinase n=1 Tax=Megasphaera paucivorans TaxID=349095 RepID=A0A1G9UGN8_9FIRM|nr:6-phosphofructokinase [Megasphaera paucivorans]SDM58973.1 6-phosphofructokinase [Megasphaera paucivorans]